MKMSKRAAFTAAFVGLLCLSGTAFAEGEGPQVDTGTTAWMLTSTGLVLLMVPGLAMFYGGLVRTKNVLGTMMHSFAAMAVVGVLWMICGYAMSFGSNVLGGWCGWNKDYFMLKGIDTTILDSGIPEYVFAMFQGKFAIITPALIAGAFAERVRFRGYCIFIALWSLLVYNPLCHWVWAEDGFLFEKGAIDFAGGTVIHISAGAAALVAAFYVGARRGYPKTAMHPNNLVMTLMGAGILWVGWFGFNAGSSVDSGLVTAQALTVTQVAAAAGALSWMILEGILHKKATTLGFVSGVLAGLVAITPAAGAVQPWGALVLGAVASVLCYLAIEMKNKLGYDDTLDVFGIHGVAALWGAIGLTFVLRPGTIEVSMLHQLWVQTEGCLVSLGYSAVMTLILLVVVEKLFGFRLTPDAERAGMDHSLHSEHGYGMLNLNS
ncbi:MAG: ammonium transporter [Pontiellaceae bacterium]|nr:ammonium transporter [Pontiellaceae bacterium]MBN2785101.1 ammonium transporter [Pontiellaceae bacterium]